MSTYFNFELTYDVIGDPEVNEIRFHREKNPGLSNTVSVLKIGPAVLEIVGGSKYPLPQSGELSKIPQSGTG